MDKAALIDACKTFRYFPSVKELLEFFDDRAPEAPRALPSAGTDPHGIFAGIRPELERRYGAAAVAAWFACPGRETTWYRRPDGSVVCVAAGPFAREQIEQRYGDGLRRMLNCAVSIEAAR